MKLLPVLLCLVLAGCQTAPLPPPAMPARPAPAVPAAVAPVSPASAVLEQKLRQQAQYIDALISQNDALAGKLAAPVASNPVAEALPAPKAPLALPPAPVAPEEDLLTPNAEGVIDLTAVASDAKAGEPVNPFAVRTASVGAVREVTLHVSGILGGKTPCAVINDRLVSANETIEALTIERIEAEAVCLRYAGQRLRVPVSDQTVKVKLPL